MIDTWTNCNHEWEVAPGDWDLGEVPGMGLREEVTCSKCGCPGERFTLTGEVDWPCT